MAAQRQHSRKYMRRIRSSPEGKEMLNARVRAYNRTRQGASARLNYLYGITLAEYDKMYKRQRGLCAICKERQKPHRKHKNPHTRLAVDHDHKTGKIRKLLCHRCNAGLGLFRDSPKLLKSAARYLGGF